MMRAASVAFFACQLWSAEGFLPLTLRRIFPPPLYNKYTASRSRSTESLLRTRATFDAAEESTVSVAPDEVVSCNAVVCGGGPAGLLSAIMLAQKFPDHKIKVFDRLSTPPSPTDEAIWNDVAKFYLIGLGSRGQKALDDYGLLKEVEERCVTVLGRKDWPPDSEEGVERVFTDRPVNTIVLPREKLVGILHKHVLDNYADSIEMNYGYEVTPIDFVANDGESVLVRVSKCEEEVTRVNPTSVITSDQQAPETLCDPDNSFVVSTGLLIAADGTARTIANRMEEEDRKKRESMNPVQRLFAQKPFQVKRYVDDNQRIYKTVPLKLPVGWRPDLNYSARTKEGRVTFDALPANENGLYCGVLLLKKDDPLAQPDSDPKELRQLLDDTLPQFSVLIDDETVAQIAKKPPSFLPAFRYAGPRLNQGDRTVILGDCAHTVKPYFGLGANTALEDAKCLGEAIDETGNIPDAVHQFSRERAGEAETVVRLSRELDRPGKLGFITFVLPLILDSIFHKLAPRLFSPNVIASLQREGASFSSVARRKRLDRIAQVVVIGGTLTGIVAAARTSVELLASALGRRSTTIVAGMGTTVLAVFFLRKFATYLVPGMAPADVLNKTKSKISDSERAGSFFFGRKGKKHT